MLKRPCLWWFHKWRGVWSLALERVMGFCFFLGWVGNGILNGDDGN